MSGRLTPAVITRNSTSPACGSGRGSCCNDSTSGPPGLVILTVFMCEGSDILSMQTHGADQAFGIGYSSAFSTQPGLFEKSTRGGQKMSTSWLSFGSIACEVWIDGGGITAIDGEPQLSWSSGRHCAMSVVQGQRR